MISFPFDRKRFDINSHAMNDGVEGIRLIASAKHRRLQQRRKQELQRISKTRTKNFSD